MDVHYQTGRLPSFRTSFTQDLPMSDSPHHANFSGRPDSGPASYQHPDFAPSNADAPAFDVLEWHPHFQSCLRYFLDHAQHGGPLQSLAAFINIQLPCQRLNNPVFSYRTSTSPPSGHASSSRHTAGTTTIAPNTPAAAISLIPYIRRLVATGFDTTPILHGFFGDDWQAGIGLLHQAERRNYLFAAKSGSWIEVKRQYDMPDGQLVPFLKPLHNVSEKEIISAESHWSEWLAMQDWMVGPRSPDVARESAAVVIKNEEP